MMILLEQFALSHVMEPNKPEMQSMFYNLTYNTRIVDVKKLQKPFCLFMPILEDKVQNGCAGNSLPGTG